MPCEAKIDQLPPQNANGASPPTTERGGRSGGQAMFPFLAGQSFCPTTQGRWGRCATLRSRTQFFCREAGKRPRMALCHAKPRLTSCLRKMPTAPRPPRPRVVGRASLTQHVLTHVTSTQGPQRRAGHVPVLAGQSSCPNDARSLGQMRDASLALRNGYNATLPLCPLSSDGGLVATTGTMTQFRYKLTKKPLTNNDPTI